MSQIMKHTDGPYTLGAEDEIEGNGLLPIHAPHWLAFAYVVVMMDENPGKIDPEGMANARRIVACLNDCHRRGAESLAHFMGKPIHDPTKLAIADLLAATKAMLDLPNPNSGPVYRSPTKAQRLHEMQVYLKLREAIANAEAI